MQPTLEVLESPAQLASSKAAARRPGEASADFAESLVQARQREKSDAATSGSAEVAEAAQESAVISVEQAQRPELVADEAEGAPHERLEGAVPVHEAAQESPLVETPISSATAALQADIAAGLPGSPAAPEIVPIESNSAENEARRGDIAIRTPQAPRGQALPELERQEPAENFKGAQLPRVSVLATHTPTEQSNTRTVDEGFEEGAEVKVPDGAAQGVSSVAKSLLPVATNDSATTRASAPEAKTNASEPRAGVRAEDGQGREGRAASRVPHTNVVRVEVESAPELDEDRATVARVERPIAGSPGAGRTQAPARVEATARSIESEAQPHRGEPAATADPASSALRPTLVAGHASAPGLIAGPRLVQAPGSEAAQQGQSADARAVEAQVTRGLMAAVRQNGGSLTIRLNPPMLGAVKVQMQLEGGVVGARIEVGVAQAHELLKGSIDSLRSALEGKGLQVERLSVHLSPGQSQPQQDQGKQDAQHGGGDRQGAHDGGDGRSRGSFDGREDRAGSRSWRESGERRSENAGEAAGGFAARLRLRLDAIA